MKIRAVTKDDYPAIGRMTIEFERYLRSLDPHAKPEKPIDRIKALTRLDIIDHGGFGLIAEIDGKPVGYLLYFPSVHIETLERTFYMPDLFVTSANRSKGIGKKLMRALVAKAKQHKVTSIDWSVYDRNPKALAFYLKLGADVVGDELMLRWKLSRRTGKRPER